MARPKAVRAVVAVIDSRLEPVRADQSAAPETFKAAVIENYAFRLPFLFFIFRTPFLCRGSNLFERNIKIVRNTAHMVVIILHWFLKTIQPRFFPRLDAKY